jgi:hypothetical protein
MDTQTHTHVYTKRHRHTETHTDADTHRALLVAVAQHGNEDGACRRAVEQRHHVARELVPHHRQFLWIDPVKTLAQKRGPTRIPRRTHTLSGVSVSGPRVPRRPSVRNTPGGRGRHGMHAALHLAQDVDALAHGAGPDERDYQGRQRRRDKQPRRVRDELLQQHAAVVQVPLWPSVPTTLAPSPRIGPGARAPCSARVNSAASLALRLSLHNIRSAAA